MRYGKMIFSMILAVCVCGIAACGTTTEENYKIEDGNLVYDTDTSTETADTTETADEIKASDKRHQVGETVEFTVDNGGEISVTITDWGTAQNLSYERIMYFSCEIENTGTEPVTVGNPMFSIYADDYSVQKDLSDERTMQTTELAAGRKIQGKIFGAVDPDTVSTLEVECGGSVFVLKDGNETSDEGSRNVVPADEDTSGSVSLPSEIKVDSEKIDYASLSGNYGGMQGMSSIDLSMYSSPEDSIVGNAEVYVQGGEYSYTGEISEVATNVYKVANTEGKEVLLAVSTEIAEYDPGENQDSGTLWIQLYVDGELTEEYMMLEHYES